ncbi:phosphatidylinositol 4-kinase alpha 1-like [Camellia sinensis]|uniref:phosphatidylinositol 4-kinase alpha 1-like n=1 Tax=Camellia sinensis TaxID=4442 RepID=UPI00103605D3|nr:phosphatidylinositol 4-kinase alpha 1-like [Camellia sinensis]
MEPLMELCDLIAQNPNQFAEKLTWMCGRCPQPEALQSGSPRVSRAQLNAVVAIARFLSKCPNHSHHRSQSLVIEFLRTIPASFSQSFWPQSFGIDSIASFYADFLAYVSKATDLSSDFAADVACFMEDIVISAVANVNGELGISRAFLGALSQSFLPILASDADKLVSCLLDHFVSYVPNSPATPEPSSSQSSPMTANYYQTNENSSPRLDVSNAYGSSSSSASRGSVMNGGSIGWKSNVDQLVASIGSVGFNDGGGGGGGGSATAYRRLVVTFEEEPVESLEKQEIAFKLITHILDKAHIDPKLLEQVRIIAKEQLQSMSSFLKIRKRDWTEQGPLLKTRINTKLSVFQAVARLKIKSLASIDSDGKLSKKLLLGTLALLVDAAEACLFSVWRKLRICEELFSSLLAGIAQIAVTRGGQLLRVLLIRLKPLVLATCAQADTWGNSQGAMFESVSKTSCEIIEFGWSKDRSPVDTFIMGLATSIRERNDYDEEVSLILLLIEQQKHKMCTRVDTNTFMSTCMPFVSF